MKIMKLSARLRPQLYAGAIVSLLATPVGAVPATFIDIGVIGAPGTFTFDTIGSIKPPGSIGAGDDVDTELGIWLDDGTLLDADDDGAGFPFSAITIALEAGTYFFGVSEFDSVFADDFLNEGTGFESGESGDFLLNVNGSLAGTGTVGGTDTTTATEETLFFRATVAEVPLPATLPLVLAGLAGLGIASRRKRS